MSRFPAESARARAEFVNVDREPGVTVMGPEVGCGVRIDAGRSLVPNGSEATDTGRAATVVWRWVLCVPEGGGGGCSSSCRGRGGRVLVGYGVSCVEGLAAAADVRLLLNEDGCDVESDGALRSSYWSPGRWAIVSALYTAGSDIFEG